jgi:hypothetical protein
VPGINCVVTGVVNGEGEDGTFVAPSTSLGTFYSNSVQDKMTRLFLRVSRSRSDSGVYGVAGHDGSTIHPSS